jgi:hypothetical protein
VTRALRVGLVILERRVLREILVHKATREIRVFKGQLVKAEQLATLD